jgi:hypothetical protein
VITIVLCADEAAKAKLKAQGFREETFLMRSESCATDEEKHDLERRLMQLGGVFQFVVTSWWGAEPD